MKLLLAQLKPEQDLWENVEIVRSVLKEYSSDIYIFPELFLSGYSAGDEIIEIAEEVEEAVRELSKAAGERLLVIGGPEKESEGRIYNTAYALGAVEHRYRKHFLPNHLPFLEKLRFHPGRGEEAFEYHSRKIGLMVCYDVFFPEIARRYAVQGVDLLITISASPFGRSVYFDTFVTARALESGAFHAYVNRVGVEGNLNFRGGSRVISPDGRTIALLPRLHESEDLEKIAIVEIDKKDLRAARLAAPMIRDLRFSPRYEKRLNF